MPQYILDKIKRTVSGQKVADLADMEPPATELLDTALDNDDEVPISDNSDTNKWKWASLSNLVAFIKPKILPSGQSTLTDAATIAWAVDTNPNATVELAGNRTMGAATGIVAGGYYAITVVQDSTGSRTLTWAAQYVFGGIGVSGQAPSLASGANERTKFVFAYEGAKMRCIGRASDI